MKLNYIHNEKQLKGGQWYIRAVINHYGRFWIELVKVNGRPFNAPEPMLGYRKIRTDTSYNSESFMGDLGVGPRKLYGSVLVKYSCKVWNKLSGINDLRTFAEVLYGQTISQQEHQQRSESFNRNIHEDDEFNKLLDQKMFGYTTYKEL